MEKSEFGKIIDSLTEIATQEVKSTGVCTIPGVCRIKWRMKPALKPKKRKVFGKVVIVKARPATATQRRHVTALCAQACNGAIL